LFDLESVRCGMEIVLFGLESVLIKVKMVYFGAFGEFDRRFLHREAFLLSGHEQVKRTAIGSGGKVRVRLDGARVLQEVADGERHRLRTHHRQLRRVLVVSRHLSLQRSETHKTHFLSLIIAV